MNFSNETVYYNTRQNENDEIYISQYNCEMHETKNNVNTKALKTNLMQ